MAEQPAKEERLLRHYPYRGREKLSMLLGPDGATGNNYKRLADKLGFSMEEIRELETKNDPVFAMIDHQRCFNVTLNKLRLCLLEMNRNDVVEDMAYYDMQTLTPSEYEENRRARNAAESVKESQNLTVLPDNLKYDAFVCYPKRDIEFAKMMLRILEGDPYHLKLCINYRDIIPGGNELSTIVNVIEERCHKVIVIISAHFSEDIDADFQAKIALSLSPGCKKRKLIPIVCDSREHVPNILRHITHLDYTSSVAREYFWPKLARGLGYTG